MLNLVGLSREYRKGLKGGKRRHHPRQRDFVTAAFQHLGKSIACLREDFSAQYVEAGQGILNRVPFFSGIMARVDFFQAVVYSGLCCLDAFWES